ncbi:peptidoglycan-binding protein [Rothia aeria]|uniref:peptidoglycan-binding protein n=1 Tax=Rothia aeria TaxID=172042 RepID=UPI00255113E0|nr:peptidoglycan-binding protein [Rothia aeria]MDK7353506.1 peptidoglycan-binding protein [Rothia aeria]
MTTDNKGLSRRKLLKAGAIGVPAAGVLAFGSTLVTATSANAISTDGWWGSETSAGLQKFLNTVILSNHPSLSFRRLKVDGWISSQASYMAPSCPGIVGGWEWVAGQPAGSYTIAWMRAWLGQKAPDLSTASLSKTDINLLQAHYGVSQDGRLDAPSRTIQALQNEINQYV